LTLRLMRRRGTVEVLSVLGLASKPMRYIDLKNRTGLPNGTLERRLTELMEHKLIVQKPLRAPSGRYYLVYEISEEKRQTKETAHKMLEGEEKLKDSYIDAIRSIPDLSKEQKEIAVKKFVSGFKVIRYIIRRNFLEAVVYAREKEINEGRTK